jgi:spore germination cell wall hydrolase CwlJ-like protein
MVNRLSITATLVMLIIALFSTLIAARDNNVILKPTYDMLTADAQKQVQCLAKNIYFEARNEPTEGMIAVAFVTLNRVNSSEFPDTICEVVEQKTRVSSIGDRRVVCQFSWFCEEVPKSIYTRNVLTNRNDPLYNEIRDLALHVYANYERMKDPTQGSLFYHANYVNPNWRNLQKVTQIGAHIFYVKKEQRT